ncbi:DUF502 domain-containing protein [Cytophaga aurantiaca]|uniref:DUF502 domain-containing protein n=1 Tax=Cytophaga aurantiaca TaxID=29530 RepID=UPI00036326A2|nr:DUF502 domain-containing protein [Cytophaga aurantiaca]
MKKILIILKNTLLRGIVFTVPILVVVIVLEQVFEKLQQIANPIADLLPYHSLFGIGKAYWAVFLILILVGLLMGLVARLKVAMNSVIWLEDNLLNRLPGYTFMKQMGESMIGANDTSAYKVVLLDIEDSWQLAYLVEELDGNMIAVYVPSVPSALDGDLFYVPKSRIKETFISYKDSIRLLHCQGRGSKKIMKGVF